MNKKDLTLSRIKNTKFPLIYKEFILNENVDNAHRQSLLSLAIVFINSENEYVQRLGYRMVVFYCNKTKNYNPLYEITMNLGLFPISKYITKFDKETEVSPSSIFFELNDSFIQNYKQNEKYQSFEQKNLSNFFTENINSTVSIIAPTSYGKTDLIVSMLNECKDKNICIITPTKSLLAQTKLRIVNSKIEWIKKIVTHPEMYNEKDRSIVAVLTQERLLRLLRKNSNVVFDYVIVDEAHSLLNKGERNVLLASVIIILKKRNQNVIFKFLTPFLNEADNLSVKFTDFPNKDFYVKENIKTEKFYVYNPKKGNGLLQLYDQYMDEFYVINSDEFSDDVSFVEKKSVQKNIIYLNKPIDIESFASKLAAIRNTIDSLKIQKACKDIAEYIHPQYNLIQHLRKGIIYHHGSVPDSIRLYIEQLYNSIPEINFVITSSTLLEGVNLPAERMFILDNKKGRGLLSPSNFKNLIGRVCRFGDIFLGNDSGLHKLEPHIYLVNSDYYSSNANIYEFLRQRSKIDKSIKDEPQNVLLKATPINDQNNIKFTEAQEFIENYENNTINSYTLRYVQTETGKACFLNNITEMSIFKVESTLQLYTDKFRKEKLLINNADTLMHIINELFFSHIIPDEQDMVRASIIRLQNETARNFYSMFLNWRIKGASFSEMIRSFLTYWEKLVESGKGTLIFVGRWGDATRGGYQALWTDIKDKNVSQRINLAIVRIKEEQDFLDNVIIKFIEVLNDLNFIEESFYSKIKYGTDDKRKITLVKNGFSLSLSNILVDKYLNYLVIDSENSTVNFAKGLLEVMDANDENQVLLNEIAYYAS